MTAQEILEIAEKNLSVEDFAEGYYSSYHGTDWDFGHGKEVFPKQKAITVYE